MAVIAIPIPYQNHGPADDDPVNLVTTYRFFALVLHVSYRPKP